MWTPSAAASGVKRIDKFCFWNSGIEEITLPSTVKEIGENTLGRCRNLKVVWVEKGCALNIGKHVASGVEVKYK